MNKYPIFYVSREWKTTIECSELAVMYWVSQHQQREALSVTWGARMPHSSTRRCATPTPWRDHPFPVGSLGPLRHCASSRHGMPRKAVLEIGVLTTFNVRVQISTWFNWYELKFSDCLFSFCAIFNVPHSYLYKQESESLPTKKCWGFYFAFTFFHLTIEWFKIFIVRIRGRTKRQRINWTQRNF